MPSSCFKSSKTFLSLKGLPQFGQLSTLGEQSFPQFGHRMVLTRRRASWYWSDGPKSWMHAFKSAVKRQCNKKGLVFEWQERYFEHIIENDEDYSRIKEYIADNPRKWEEDRNNHLEKENVIFKKNVK